jgi:hypothetical protein
MWLFTDEGFVSAVRKGHGEANLVVRSRSMAALGTLSEFARTAIVRTPRADYPFRVHVTPETWGEFVKTVAVAVDYRNFKTQVKKTLGRDHSDALGLVWKAMVAVQDQDARTPLNAEYLEQPVDHYFYEVWSPNGECVSDGVCTVAELPQLRRNVEAEWLELVTWPQPKYVGPIVQPSHISEQPHAPLVGAQWSPLIQVIAEMFQALGSDPERFMRVDFYSDKYSYPIYVQAKQFDNGTYTVEAISNQYLKTKLTDRQHEAMLFMDWDLKDSNYVATFEGAEDLSALAEYVVNTLVIVYGIDENCSFGLQGSSNLEVFCDANFHQIERNGPLWRLKES